jgi:hypothetical protein
MILAFSRESTLQIRRSPYRGGSAGCSIWHPIRLKAGQAGMPDEDAVLKEAIFEHKVDIRGEVFQVKPTSNPGTPKQEPMRIRVRCEPSTQDVADHRRPAGPRIAPRSHRSLINRLIIGG